MKLNDVRTNLGTRARKSSALKRFSTRIVALVVAAEDTSGAISKHLLRLGMEVHLTPGYGAMASMLFDRPESKQPNVEILFVLDLRLSCGASEIDTRLGDYDAVLNAHMMSGMPWPKTLCLIESEQTRPEWLQTQPHLRATLLADEVETVIGHPRQHGWKDSFTSALDCCLRG